MANTELNYESFQDVQGALSALARECRDDPGLFQRLDADPRAFFGERSVDLPAGFDFRVAANTPEVFHLVMPQDPNAVIGDQELTQVSGGTPASSLSSIPSTISSHSSVAAT